MQLVLYLGKERFGCRSVLFVVDPGGIYVGDFLVKAALAEPYFPDLFKQALKIVLAKKGPVSHALFVQHITLYGKFAQNLGGPLPELRRPNGVYPVTDQNYSVEIVMLCGG